ncbi:MAG: DUF3656 domain-containing U32 family peptidase, partial [Limisphaerales bacterium]
RIYRQALDALGGGAAPPDAARMPGQEPEKSRYEMEMAFSRGLYSGWLRGVNNQELVHARFGKKRGVYLGEIREVCRDGVIIGLEAPLKLGDGVVFDAGRPEEKEDGGRVYEIAARGRNSSGPPTVLLRFGMGDIDFRRIHVGDRLWKTSDPELERELRKSFEGDGPKFQRPLHFEVHGFAGHPLVLVAHDELGRVARLESSMPLVRAEKQPLTVERLRDQLGRLGGTPFELAGLRNALEGDVMLPVSELNRLRRQIVAELVALRGRSLRWRIENEAPGLGRDGEAFTHPNGSADAQDSSPELIVLVRTLPQLESAIQCGVATIYCDFDDTKKYREAVSLFRSAGAPEDSRQIFVAPPRIFKMGEEWILNQVRSCEADGYLVRNYDHLRFFREDECVGDYSLNVANHLSAQYFKQRFGLTRLTASYDLNVAQLEALLHAAPAQWFEVTLHQHMPMFHMEHCVFCAFLSKGTDYTNCGRPCDKHDLKLRDRVGAEHPVKADVGCRNTVFNALAQTGAEYASRMRELGVKYFRIEFLNESPEQVSLTITKYRALLRGDLTGTQLWRELKLFNQLGVTRGQLAGSAMRS